MKKIALAALAAALAACGGSSDAPDPASRKFTYGEPQAPSSAELIAADTAEGSTADAVTVQDGTAVDGGAAGSSMMSLPDAMAEEVWGSDVYALQPAGLERSLATLEQPATLSAALAYDPACVTVAEGKITYAGCTVTMDTQTVTVNGVITRSGPVVSWDVTTTLVAAYPTYSANASVHATGSLTFGAGTVTGQARSDSRASVSAQGYPTVRIAYTTLADLDLEFGGDPLCITGGTLELRRVWTERPMGMGTDGPYADQGLLFSWAGCGTVKVARSK